MTHIERIICGLVLLKDYVVNIYNDNGNLCIDVFPEPEDEIHYMLLKSGWTYSMNGEDNKIMYSYAL